jgi:3-deoxy-D-manno-octulosonate 8-phosphate phosphatase (KDO 8-P phosphatase)
MDIDNKLSKIKLAVFDVDGVLTDGKLYFNDQGIEHKAFDVRDGLGIKLLMDSDVEVAIITGRKSQASRARLFENLGIRHYYEGKLDKLSTLHSVVEGMDLSMSEVLYMGDDLIDLSVMLAVGVSVAVDDAVEEVKEVADIISSKKGGCGAVREVCEKILSTKGYWNKVIAQFKKGKKYTN